ncbi:hypothetical protein Tco_0069543, partial [Tanacetum coccineum]
IMETEAIDNQANLVNYDNEIEDLGYESEEYTEDAHEDDENNHSNGDSLYFCCIYYHFNDQLLP